MERDKALDMALSQIEKQFGKGSVMRMGENLNLGIESIPTGAMALDLALGIGGLPRGRIVEIYGPESSGKSTLAMHVVAEAQRNGGICAYIDAEHAMDPVYAGAIGVNVDDLLISQPDTGEQALEIADMLIRSGRARRARHRLGGRPHAAGRDRRRDGRQPRRAAGPADVAGAAQADRHAVEVRHHRRLHQPAAREDRRDVRIPRGHPGWPGAQVLFVGAPRHPPGRADQGRCRGDRQPHPGEGREEQGQLALQAGRVRHHVRPGISREGSLLDVGVELGLIKKSGAWFTYEGEQLGQGRENAKQFLVETPELMIEINERIRSQLAGTVLPAGTTVGAIEDRRPRRRSRTDPSGVSLRSRAGLPSGDPARVVPCHGASGSCVGSRARGRDRHRGGHDLDPGLTRLQGDGGAVGRR